MFESTGHYAQAEGEREKAARDHDRAQQERQRAVEEG